MFKSRLLDVLAMMLIGNGVLTLFDTSHQLQLWRKGPSRWQRLIDFFSERPYLARTVGALRLGAGLLLATRQRAPES